MPFPVAPILDTGTRPDEGPPPSISWSDDPIADGIKIVSNRFAPDGASGVSWWNTLYGPDSEVYITVTTLPGDGQSVKLFGRFDSQDLNGAGYQLTYNHEIITPPSVFVLSDPNVDILGVNQTLAVGDSFGLQMNGSLISIWYKPAAGVWTLLGSVVNSAHTAAGYIGLELQTVTTRAVDFGGGNSVDWSTLTGPQVRSTPINLPVPRAGEEV